MQIGCSGSQESGSPAYDVKHEPKPDDIPGRDEIRLILPDEPPRLPPAAARALLRILLHAHARLSQQKREASP